MHQEEVFYPPTLNDITLDDQGRVIVHDSQINEALLAAAAKTTPKPEPTGPITNNGCTVNTVKGCGVKG